MSNQPHASDPQPDASSGGLSPEGNGHGQEQTGQPEQSREPIGQLLKRAGLISDSQIQLALMDQSQHNLLFGEVLVMRGWLKHQTLLFFLDNFSRAAAATQTITKQETVPIPLKPPEDLKPPANRSPQATTPEMPIPEPPGDPVADQAIKDDFDDLINCLAAGTWTEDQPKKPSSNRSQGSQPQNRRLTNHQRTESYRVDGYLVDEGDLDEESLDLAFEGDMTEAELRALLNLD